MLIYISLSRESLVTAHKVKKANIINLCFFEPYPPPTFPCLRASGAKKELSYLKRNAIIYTPFPKTREGLGDGFLFFIKRVCAVT